MSTLRLTTFVLLLLGGAEGVCPAAADETAATRTAEPPSVSLAEMSLEQLLELQVGTVYSASKHQQSVSEAPASVSIVTREDIQQLGHRTLADVLRGVRGFYGTYNRSYNAIGVRGFSILGDYGGRSLVMIDGHRLNDPVFDDTFAGTEFPLDLDLVERVEVVRGPGSTLYGNNAFFCVINVITRRGKDINAVEASGAAGGFETYSGRFTLGRAFTNGVELTLSGTYFQSAGDEHLYYPEFQEVNNGVAEDLDDQRMMSLHASLRYGGFTLAGTFGSRKKQFPTAPSESLFNDPNNWLKDDRGYVEARFQHEFSDETTFTSRVYYDYYNFDGAWPYPYGYQDPPPPGMVTVNRDAARWHGVGGELQASRTLGENHRLTLGAEFRRDLELSLENRDEDPPSTYVEVNENATTVGVYVQDEFSIRTNLILNAGLRYDWFSQSGDTWNPRAALIYNPWQDTTLKLIYGQAYRTPNVSEWAYESMNYRSNPSLQAETIRTYEFVVEQSLGDHWQAAASLYWNDVQDLIGWSYDAGTDQYYADNTRGARARGVELSLGGRWTSGLRTHLNYTFADATDTETGAQLSNSPRHLGQFDLVVPLYREKVFAGFELQAMSSRLSGRGVESGAYAVANLTLFSRELIKNLECSVSLYNLFDTHYGDPADTDYGQDVITQDGRSFRCKLTYRF